MRDGVLRRIQLGQAHLFIVAGEFHEYGGVVYLAPLFVPSCHKDHERESNRVGYAKECKEMLASLASCSGSSRHEYSLGVACRELRIEPQTTVFGLTWNRKERMTMRPERTQGGRYDLAIVLCW